MKRRSILKGFGLLVFAKDNILANLKWFGFKQKSYYQIHGEFPFGNQALPADGFYFYLDMSNDKSKECNCKECNLQRKYFHYRKNQI
jgi:hypothetical protein